MGKCDKCREQVPLKNDAVALESFLQMGAYKPTVAFFHGSRHLLPTDKCEGSPSRAQYLEGQAKDARLSYPYSDTFEPKVRSAYRQLQEFALSEEKEAIAKELCKEPRTVEEVQKVLTDMGIDAPSEPQELLDTVADVFEDEFRQHKLMLTLK